MDSHNTATLQIGSRDIKRDANFWDDAYENPINEPKLMNINESPIDAVEHEIKPK